MTDAESANAGDPTVEPGDEMAPARDIHAVQPQQEIRNALRASELVMHYQPIVRLDTLEITAVEALLRWEHPDGVTLMPDDFLPSVAQAPVMRDVTRYVLGRACRDASRWPDWSVSVNVAASDVVHPDFADDVVRALDESGLDPQRLTLELTEQSVVQDVTSATTNLQQLQLLGVGIALDDFGTGYSSLLYLRALPVTQVKIDRLFIAAMQRSEDDEAIVESVVRLARTIKLDVVAEGVETPGQAQFLQSVACGGAQGYLFGRPQPADQLSRTTTSEWVGVTPVSGRRSRRRPAVDDATLQQVQSLLSEGASLHTVAAALNRSGVTTHQGTRWSARSVAQIVADLPDVN